MVSAENLDEKPWRRNWNSYSSIKHYKNIEEENGMQYKAFKDSINLSRLGMATKLAEM